LDVIYVELSVNASDICLMYFS